MSTRITNTIFVAAAWLKHQLCAWNTGGEGIHSPYLFHLVRLIISDDNRYYSWDAIEERRRAMLRAPKRIDVTDYGSKGQGATYSCLVSDIAKNSLEAPSRAQTFFRIVNWLSHETDKPLNIIELGTNLGITTAYLATPSTANNVTTFEGSGALVEMAQLNWRKLGLTNIRVREGNIDETLPVSGIDKYDVAYIDANHRYQPTVNYADFFIRRAAQKSIVIIDDIHYSPEMQQAWTELRQRPEVTSTMDFFHFGILFFDNHYLKRNYRLRL